MIVLAETDHGVNIDLPRPEHFAGICQDLPVLVPAEPTPLHVCAGPPKKLLGYRIEPDTDHVDPE